MTAIIKKGVSLTVSLLYIMLFVYAAVSKLVDFENFRIQLGQSPLLSAFAGWVSWMVPVFEILIAILLSISRYREFGLYGGVTLMAVFSAYIVVILNYASFIPCSCGGILEEMGWKAHLAFNIVFTLLGLAGLFAASDNRRRTFIISFILTVIGTALIIVLFIASEDKMHRENPFIRRFIQGAATKDNKIMLENNYKYFAGADSTWVYIADSQAPLYIVAYDRNLKTIKRHKIVLERYDFPFQQARIHIAPPYFYLYDGTVPVIFKGTIDNWKAKPVMSGNNYFFSKGEVTGPDQFTFRAQEIRSLDNIIGQFDFSETLAVQYAPELLVKQADGFFDTDGMLEFDNVQRKLVYVYYYRNEFLVASNKLALLQRGRTIDTTAHPQIKVSYKKGTRQRRLTSMVQTVNRLTAVNNNRLFINSNLLGKYEPKDMWNEASIVDVYDLNNTNYIESIYIYHENGAKLTDMLIEGGTLYAIVGQHLAFYRLKGAIARTSRHTGT